MGLTKPRAAQIFDLDYKQATRVVTTTNITLSGGAPSQVDSVNLNVSDRILVTGQATGSQNGIYKISVLGTGSNGTWIRSSDGDTTGEIESGMIVMVTEGAIYADTQWKLITDDPITIGSTALIFTQNYSANSISGGTSNVVVYSNANVAISSAGTANVLVVSGTGAFVTGEVSATGNVTGGNVTTAGLISSTGNVTVGNVNTAGQVTATGNIQGGNLRTVGLISATGNVLGGNILSAGAISAAGNLAVDRLTVANSQATSVQITGGMSVGGGVIAGALNMTTGGTTLFNSNTSDTIGTAKTTATITIGGTVQTGAVTVGQSTANSTLNLGTGATSNANTKNINIGTGGVTGSNTFIYLGPIGGGSGGIGLVQTQGNTTVNITNTGANALSVAGNITGGNIRTAGSVSATGNITGNFIFGNGSQLTGITVSTTYGDSNVVSLLASFGSNNISTTGNITAGNVNTPSADLAELYVSDANYPAGTVVEFGGQHEITVTTNSHSTKVAGVVSTDPGHVMNSAQSGVHVLPVALTGRVPCRVVGAIAKGDRLVASDHAGVAQRLDPVQYQPGCIIGKSLEDYNSEQAGTIEIAVGRF